MHSKRVILPDIRQCSGAMLGIMIMYVVVALFPVQVLSQVGDDWFPLTFDLMGAGLSPREITTDPDGRIFIGTYMSGVYRSTNGGTQWEHVVKGLPFDTSGAPFISSLFCHSNGTLFTSFTPSGDYHVPSIYRSTNHGDSWERFIADNPAPIHAFAEDSSGGIYAGSGNGIILYSSDNGDHWSSIRMGCDTHSVTAIAVAPNGDIYAGINDGCNGSTLFRSTDKGEHWTALGFTAKNVRRINFTSRGDILAITGGRSSMLGLSRDQGATWNNIGKTPVQLGSESRSIIVMPDDRIIIEFQGKVYTSSDYGATWTSFSSPLPGDHSVKRLWQSKAGELFALTGSVLYRSTDNDTKWQAVCDFPRVANADMDRLHVSAIATSGWIQEFGSYYMYLGTRGQGIYTSLNSGWFWQPRNIHPGIDTINAILAAPDGAIYAGGPAGLFRSSDNGMSWPLTAVALGAGEVEITTLMSDTGTAVFAGTSNAGIFRSLDNGSTWTPQNTGISDLSIASLTADSSGRLFAVTPHALFISGDRGDTWQAVNTSSITAALRNVVMARYGRIALGTDRGMFISADNGASWQPSLEGIGERGINALAANPEGHLIAATDAGVFSSIDGDSWKYSSMPNVYPPISCIEIQRENLMIYMGTSGAGAFRRDMFLSGVERQNIGASASAIRVAASPNPARSLVTFHVDLRRGGNLTLDIYNTMGQRIASPLTQYFEPGTYSLPWNPGDCPAGTYFFRFRLGDETGSGMLVVE